jgi:hypothetical protein
MTKRKRFLLIILDAAEKVLEYIVMFKETASEKQISDAKKELHDCGKDPPLLPPSLNIPYPLL